MLFSRILRRWLTACTLGFMLLAQQSVAAYACTTSLQDMAQAAAAMPDSTNPQPPSISTAD
jgi:hypothetical protein